MTTGVLSDSTVTSTTGTTNTLAAWLAGMTVSGSSKTLTGTWTASAFIPTSSVAPSNGMYLPAANTIGWSISSTAEMLLNSTALTPAVSDGLTLGTSTLMWSDAFFASGAVLNFNNGDVTVTHSANLLTVANGGLTLYSSRTQGEFIVEGDTTNAAPAVRARGKRGDANTSVDFAGQFVAEGIRTDAMPASGKVFGGLIFGGNTDLTPTMGYTASITGVADAAWVDASNAATAIVFRTGVTAQARAANISYGTDRGRITSGGRWLLGSSTDDGSTTVQVNGNAKSTGYFLRSVGNALTATGTTRADALQLAKEVNHLTTVASGTGVILPVGVIGMRIRIYQSGANPVKVYASASETIDGTAGSTGVTLTNALRCEYEFVAANTWISAPLGVVSA